MRIAMGCCETVVLGIPRPCTAMGCCVLSGEHTFSEEQEEMHVEYSSGVQRGLAYGWACDALLCWGSRCLEVTQRAVLRAEEESQRETASDTL